MGAFITKPSEGDSVSNPVPVEVEFNFSSSTNVTRHVGVDQDSGTNYLGGPLKDTKDVHTTLTGLQRVSIQSGGVELNAQDNVNIQGGPIPIEIDEAVQEVTQDMQTVLLVKGDCHTNSLPQHPFVACVVFSINPNGIRNAVTIGFDVPSGKKHEWTVKLKYKRLDQHAYVVRAFLVNFQNPFTIVGATTESI